MKGRSLPIWTLSLRPTSIAVGLVVAVLLGDSAIAIVLGARSASLRRESVRLRSRIDSLGTIRQAFARRVLLLDAIVDASKGRIRSAQATKLAEEIDRNAQLYRFDPLLILAVVLTESRGHFEAVGRLNSGALSGAVGVMQVQPATALQIARSLGIEVTDSTSLSDPAFNLTVGVAYLLQMVHRYNDLRLGIMAYNVGASGLESALRGNSDLPEEYYRKVLGKYRQLLALRHDEARVENRRGTPTAIGTSLDRDIETGVFAPKRTCLIDPCLHAFPNAI